MKSLLTVFFVLCVLFVYPIKNTNFSLEDNKGTLGLTTRVNYSWLKNNLNINNFRTTEIILGISYERAIIGKFTLSPMLNLGIKLSRKYDYRFDNIYPDDPNYYGDWPIYKITEIDRIDRTLSKEHFFIELPFLIKYKLFPKFKIDAGFSTRYYTPMKNSNNSYEDFYQSKFEFGITSGFAYDLSKKLSVQIYYSSSISKIYSNYNIVDSHVFNSYLKARCIGFTLLYKI